MRLSKLTQELALALEVASIAQAWGNPSPFQDKINELLVKAGRKPVAPNKSVYPTKGGLTLRACVNGECGWIGKESACLTYKHAGDERLCPHCNDNTESVSLSALRG